jgi:hypothetical protein
MAYFVLLRNMVHRPADPFSSCHSAVVSFALCSFEWLTCIIWGRVPTVATPLCWTYCTLGSGVFALAACTCGAAYGGGALASATASLMQLRLADAALAREVRSHPSARRSPDGRFVYSFVRRMRRSSVSETETVWHLVELSVVPNGGKSVFSRSYTVEYRSVPLQRYVVLSDNLVQEDIDRFSDFEDDVDDDESTQLELHAIRASLHACICSTDRVVKDPLFAAAGLAIAEVHEARRRRDRAAAIIQAAWLRCTSTPSHPACVRRLRREFAELNDGQISNS